MVRDGGLQRGDCAECVVQVDRGQCVVAAEGKQIPVVIPNAVAKTLGFSTARSDRDPASPVVPDPANEHVLLLAHAELVEGEVHRLAHTADVASQELEILRPREIVATASEVEGICDRMPRVDRRDDRGEVNLGPCGALEPDSVSNEYAGVLGMLMQRHVGVAHRRRHRHRHLPPSRPLRFTLQLPLQTALHVCRCIFHRPFEPRERGHDDTAAKTRGGDRDDIGAGLQLQPLNRIDPLHLGAGNLPSLG